MSTETEGKHMIMSDIERNRWHRGKPSEWKAELRESGVTDRRDKTTRELGRVQLKMVLLTVFRSSGPHVHCTIVEDNEQKTGNVCSDAAALKRDESQHI